MPSPEIIPALFKAGLQGHTRMMVKDGSAATQPSFSSVHADGRGGGHTEALRGKHSFTPVSHQLSPPGPPLNGACHSSRPAGTKPFTRGKRPRPRRGAENEIQKQLKERWSEQGLHQVQPLTLRLDGKCLKIQPVTSAVCFLNNSTTQKMKNIT